MLSLNIFTIFQLVYSIHVKYLLVSFFLNDVFVSIHLFLRYGCLMYTYVVWPIHSNKLLGYIIYTLCGVACSRVCGYSYFSLFRFGSTSDRSVKANSWQLIEASVFPLHSAHPRRLDNQFNLISFCLSDRRYDSALLYSIQCTEEDRCLQYSTAGLCEAVIWYKAI